MKKTAFLMLGFLVLAGGMHPAQARDLVPPATPPIGYDRPPSSPGAPLNWIPKPPGHYRLTDWRRVIDSTWGEGLSVPEKLAIFDLFWDCIDGNFACFNNLTVNWDSLRSVFRPEVQDTVSRGRFAAIMSQLALALREGHTNIMDLPVANTELLPGVPLWVIGAWWNVGHFGAGLTPLPDRSLLVYRVAPNHPLELVPGDVVLGYDRRPWTEILGELQEAQLPICDWYAWGSANSSMEHSLLNAAGMNWHLFDTIDIVKYSTGDTVHLPTSLLVGQSMSLLNNEQMDIPGVPMPDQSIPQAASYGVVSGTRIGYIYVWRWWDNAEAEFSEAVDALVSDTTLQGMIIDFRYNEGGNMFMSNSGLSMLFRDSTMTTCMSERNDPLNRYTLSVVYPASGYVIPGNGIGYDKPIAVLTGPGAVSSGDQVAFRMKFHPRVRIFGKSTNTAFNAPVELNVHTDWYMRYAKSEACLASDTNYFLTHREFEVDVPVWHTREAVAHDQDAVVNAAMAWIDSITGVAEEAANAEVRRTDRLPTIVRGLLEMPAASSIKPQASSWLLDISGREVLKLRPGANDVSRLAPGVYFVRYKPQASSSKLQAVRKVIVAH